MTTTLDVQKTALPVLYLTSWINAGNQCGINALQPFDTIGLNIDLSTGHQVKAPPLQLLQALNECTKASRDIHFPLSFGSVVNFDHMPAVGTFLATSPTIRASLRLVNWALQLVNPWMRIDVHEHGDEAWLTFEQVCFRSAQAPHLYVTEAAMVAVNRLTFGQLNGGAEPLAVHFTHDKPLYHEQYQRHFLIEPRYNQTRNAIFFKRHFLDQPLPGGRAHLHEQAFGVLMAHLPPVDKLTTFSQGVIDRLVTQPALMSGGLPGVAEAFGMKGRALQRRLNKEGQGFTDILNQAQQTLATRWLADTGLDITEISVRLGYKSRRAFSNAFKKWTGVSPSQYKIRLKK